MEREEQKLIENLDWKLYIIKHMKCEIENYTSGIVENENDNSNADEND